MAIPQTGTTTYMLDFPFVSFLFFFALSSWKPGMLTYFAERISSKNTRSAIPFTIVTYCNTIWRWSFGMLIGPVSVTAWRTIAPFINITAWSAVVSLTFVALIVWSKANPASEHKNKIITITILMQMYSSNLLKSKRVKWSLLKLRTAWINKSMQKGVD